MPSPHVEIRCPGCQDRSLLSPAEIVSLLRSLGMFRRQAEPEWTVMWELLRGAANRIACPSCQRMGVSLRVIEDDDWGDDWRVARLCRSCQAPLPPERLELLPDATLCAACQAQTATDESLKEYCPRCGQIMQLRSRDTGITRYVMQCPECG